MQRNDDRQLFEVARHDHLFHTTCLDLARILFLHVDALPYVVLYAQRQQQELLKVNV